MENRKDDPGRFPQRPLHQKLQPFAPYSSPSLKSLDLGAGGNWPLPNALRSFHQGNQEPDARLIEAEQNSSLTPLDLICSSTARTGQDGSETTSGITPCSSWFSFVSAFKVPSISNNNEQRPGEIPVPDLRHILLAQDHPGRVEGQSVSSEDYQTVPVLKCDTTSARNGGLGAAVGASSSPKAEHGTGSFAAQSSQFSSSWPVEHGHKIPRDGGSLSAGSTNASLTAAAYAHQQQPSLISGQKNKGTILDSGSGSPFLFGTEKNSIAFQKVAVGDRGKKVEDGTPMMNFGSRNDEFREPAASEQGVRRSSAALDSMELGYKRRGLSEPQEQDNAVRMEQDWRGESEAQHCNKEDAQQPMATEAAYNIVHVESSNRFDRQTETEKYGQKHSRLRSFVDEAGTSGFMKRSRQLHPNYISWKLEIDKGTEQQQPQREQEGNGDGAGMESNTSCNWLQRWLPAGSSVVSAATVADASKLKESPRLWNGSPGLDGRSTNRLMGLSGKGPYQISMDAHGRDGSSDLFSQERIFHMSTFSTPSASAIAMMGSVTRRSGLEPQSALARKSSMVHMWTSDSKKSQVRHVKFSDQQKSS